MEQYDLDTLMKYVKKGQMTREEYSYIGQYLGSVNFLIFGTGYDTPYWRYKNKGLNIFLEHDKNWIPKNSTDIYQIQYSTSIANADLYLKNPDDLKINLPQEVTSKNWDVIFVDAPPGNKDTSIGRMQSIYCAYTLASANTEIFVHDCDRDVEKKYTDHFFTVVTELTKLRHCRKMK